MADPRRLIPRTDAVLADPRIADAERELGRAAVKSVIAAAQESARSGRIAPEEVPDAAVAALPRHASALHPVINATGIIVHTNLGRAPLSAAARSALDAAAGATDVEFDLATGRRARRGVGALAALAEGVPAAEAVHVVNSNAGALLLCALALARDREILISRGEMVEIGDGFRIPDLLAGAGARLREVGTTNRTKADDFASAIGPETAFILKVHPSNFHIRGFTSTPGIGELAELDAPLIADIGSGLLRPHPRLPDEPDAASTLEAGADLVTASGDKLLGGPQAGLLLGKSDLVTTLRRHPTARALRVDKLTLAALEATLRGPAPPVVARLNADTGELTARAERLAAELRTAQIDAVAVSSSAAIGGGGAPGVELPSAAVSLPAHYAEALRAAAPDPVVARVENGRCLLDLRTVGTEEEGALVRAVRSVGG